MIYATNRHETNPKKFFDQMNPEQIRWGYVEGQTFDDLVTDKILSTLRDKKHIIILVHGFASSMKGVTSAYAEFSGNLYQAFAGHREKRNAEIFGFTWPSNGIVSISNYFSDFKEAKDSGYALRSMIQALRKYIKDADPIIIAHSMGCRVAAECLFSMTKPIKKAYFVSGDVKREHFEVGGRYSMIETPIDCLYADTDGVVGFWARILRPGGRIGALPIQNPPAGIRSVDATVIQGGAVEHRSYKSSQPIADWIVDNIIMS